MLLSEMPLHHCVAALDTGFLLTYLLARLCPGFMEAGVGLNPPSSCSDTVVGMDGNTPRSCWSLCPAFCPSWSGKVPCVVSTHPSSSSRSVCSANEALAQPACPSGTLELCAITTLAWDRREIPLQAQGSFLLQQTHKPSNSHCVFALPGIVLLVNQSFKLLSYFYLPAISSG